MEYDIQVKNVKSIPVVFGTAEGPQQEIPNLIGNLMSGAVEHAQAQGGEIAGPPFTRYLEMQEGHVRLQAGIPISGDVESGDDFEAGELPGGEVAVVVHIGPYDKLPEAYQAVARWLEEQGRSQEGAPWEFYWTDPEQEPDPENWKTEIFFPLS